MTNELFVKILNHLIKYNQKDILEQFLAEYPNFDIHDEVKND